MPIYMDRHDVSENVTAENVAQLHQQDLKIQHKFNCRGLTYWFDEKRKTAFCLVEAPDAENIKRMHDVAHGEVPHRIIEVDANIVESFLGRIEDPEKAQNVNLNIINDPAFRTLVVVRLHPGEMKELLTRNFTDMLDLLHETIENAIGRFKGRLVKHHSDQFLLSFTSISDAFNFSMEIASTANSLRKKEEFQKLFLGIGLHAGLPVTEKDHLFEDTIILAERLCDVTLAEIVVSTDAKELYESENRHWFVDDQLVSVLTPEDERFITRLYNYTENIWQESEVMVMDFCSHLGLSKSNLYRKMMALLGSSPKNFIKNYRLKKALEMLNHQKGNVSEIAFASGFGSPSYFTKCFAKEFNKMPSQFLHVNN
jgi:AraC-like DNA-binding protein